ncbi:hypothetical protein [Kangiella taiwanensis]|uniref:DedA family protein n=1 Tax=Kangiella taiwanensis TaxID=1079179 RepID=A0ABP8HRP8_9GAMM|nr:hypothetical protein [Kangiella taiwanensis]
MNASLKKYSSSIWGFSEATLFFILPDVLLSYFALERKAKLLPLIAWALLGALVGGVIMFTWGVMSPKTSWSWVEAVPAINTDLMDTVAKQLEDKGALAIILGPFQGLPYKAYSVQAASADIGLILFIAVSVVARFIRFLLIAYIARAASVLLMSRIQMSKRGVTVVWLITWITVYTSYFYYFPS